MKTCRAQDSATSRSKYFDKQFAVYANERTPYFNHSMLEGQAYRDYSIMRIFTAETHFRHTKPKARLKIDLSRRL